VFNEHYKIYRIILLASLGVICGMAWTIIGTIASVIVLAFLVDQFIFGGGAGKWLHKKIMLRKPFVIFSEPKPGSMEQSVVLPISRNKQCFNLTLKMGVESWVLFLAIQIVGQGVHPRITTLYNWEWGIDKELIDIYPPYYVQGQDCWYWTYHSRHLRHKGSRITIGVECLAESQFNGEIEVALSAESWAGRIKLPLEVKGAP